MIVPAETCDVEVCDSPPALLWQRYLTPAEYAQLMLTPLAPIDGIARIAVRGCAGHAMSEDKAHFTHRPDCPWPSPCACDEADAPVAYTPVQPTTSYVTAPPPQTAAGPLHVPRRAG